MNKKLKLSAELDAGHENETYNLFNTKTEFGSSQVKQLMSKSVVNGSFLKKPEVPSYEVSMRQQKKQRRAERDKTKGKEWFDLPAGEMTEQAKNDLTLIKMRAGLHKDRFFKANDTETLPKYFQMGNIVDDAVDYYSTRVPKKQKKSTILEELVEDAKVKKFTKKHYEAIQAKEERRRKILSSIMKKNKKRSRK